MLNRPDGSGEQVSWDEQDKEALVVGTHRLPAIQQQLLNDIC